MRILNGLKYTVVDQFKVLAMTLASVFVVFHAMIILFTSSNSPFLPFSYPFFISLSVVIMVFMGISYTPIYFRTLIQGGFTRIEIFIIQVITDIIILLSGSILIFLSVLPMMPAEVYRSISLYMIGDTLFLVIFSVLASRTLFNCFGLIINKFDNRFAAGVVGVTSYFLFGSISRITNTFEITEFIENHGVIFSILCLATLLVIEFFIIKTHNSKPIAK